MGSTENGKFTKSTKEALRRRAGSRCCNPKCNKITMRSAGPCEDDPDLGQAAHIEGCNSSSARFDPSMTEAERSSEENGIHLSCTCHRRIDNIETRDKYSVKLLHKWKFKCEG